MEMLSHPLVIALLMALVGALSYFMRRSLQTQDEMNKSLQSISQSIVKLETWATYREKVDDDRHKENQRAIQECKDESESIWNALRQH